MTLRVFNGPNNGVLLSNATIIFTGTGNTLGLSHYGSPHDDMVFCYGSQQTVSVSGQGANDKIVDLGKGLNLATWGQFGALTVYDFQFDKTSHLTLLHFQQDVAASDGHGGTVVSVFAGGPVASGKIDFVGDTHVKVVHT